MAQIDSIAGGVEEDLMHPLDVAFAKRNNLDFALSTFAHNFLEGDSSSGGCIFFLLMMALKNLPRIVVFQSSARSRDNLKKQIHTNGKVRSIKKPGLRREHHLLQSRQLVVPPGRSDDKVLTGSYASFSVSPNRRRSGEVNDYIDGGQEFGRQSTRSCVFGRR